MKLKNIIELWNTSPGGLDIVLEDNAFVTFMVGVDNQTQTQLGRLQIEDVYDETYLLAHSIISGNELFYTRLAQMQLNILYIIVFLS